MKLNINIDFDGVINSYVSGWDNEKGEAWLPDEPIPGAKEAINSLKNQYKITVHTTRAKTETGKGAIIEWLKRYDIHFDCVTVSKLPAVFSIDDRAITFKGDWSETLQDIKEFKQWQQ